MQTESSKYYKSVVRKSVGEINKMEKYIFFHLH